MDIRWENGFEIATAINGDGISISANKEGLISLANIMLDLAEGMPGDHVHLDEGNSLEDGSVELVIERVE